MVEQNYAFDESATQYGMVFEGRNRTAYCTGHDKNPRHATRTPWIGTIIHGKEPLGSGITCYEVKVEDGNPGDGFAIGIAEKPEGPEDESYKKRFWVWSNGTYRDDDAFPYRIRTCKSANRRAGPVVYKILFDRPRGKLYTVLNQELIHEVRRDFSKWDKELFLSIHGYAIKVTMTFSAVSKEMSLLELAEAKVLETLRESDRNTTDAIIKCLPQCMAKPLKWKLEDNKKSDCKVSCATREPNPTEKYIKPRPRRAISCRDYYPRYYY